SELTCMVCELRSIAISTDASASGMEKVPQHKAQAPRMARMTGSFGRLARPAPEGLSFRKSHVNRKVLVRFTNSIPCVAVNKDVCRASRLGTYLKALAAHDNSVPFYVALPSSTIDWRISDGLREIQIEERDQSEVTHICGRTEHGETVRVRLTPIGSPARNFGFDVTPARLVSALITERGACAANEAA